jgi:hypothetical protein
VYRKRLPSAIALATCVLISMGPGADSLDATCCNVNCSVAVVWGYSDYAGGWYFRRKFTEQQGQWGPSNKTIVLACATQYVKQQPDQITNTDIQRAELNNFSPECTESNPGRYMPGTTTHSPIAWNTVKKRTCKNTDTCQQQCP